MIARAGLVSAGGLLLFNAALASAGEESSSFAAVADQYGLVLQTPDGRTVFRYMTRRPTDTKLTANSVCCLYPLNTPTGVRVVDFAPSDHPHHRGVYLAWHAMTCDKQRADFWGWGSWAPTDGRVIRNRSIKLTEADANHAVLAVHNDWMIGEETVIQEVLSITTREQGNVYVVDLDFQLTPEVDGKIDRTAFGGFVVRGRKDGKSKYVCPQGEKKLDRPHHLKPETNWPDADWYDYALALADGKTIGVAVINAPDNPPTTWHNLQILAMVNPCVAAPAEIALRCRKPLRLRYRLVVHDGPVPMDLIKELSAQWRHPSPARGDTLPR